MKNMEVHVGDNNQALSSEESNNGILFFFVTRIIPSFIWLVVFLCVLHLHKYIARYYLIIILLIYYRRRIDAQAPRRDKSEFKIPFLYICFRYLFICILPGFYLYMKCMWTYNNSLNTHTDIKF